jgi:hypothetical protein
MKSRICGMLGMVRAGMGCDVSIGINSHFILARIIILLGDFGVVLLPEHERHVKRDKIIIFRAENTLRTTASCSFPKE